MSAASLNPITRESDELVVTGLVMNLNGFAADFAVFDILLSALFREIQKHRDLLETIRALKSFFDFHFAIVT